MITALIIDDEPLARSLIQSLLKPYENIRVIGEATNGFEGAKMIAAYKPSLIFLDVKMPRLTGFEMLEILEPPLPSVIFTTAFDEYAVQAFDAAALDYLLKPIAPARFKDAIDRFLRHSESFQPHLFLKKTLLRLVVKVRDEIKIIENTEINYLQAADDYIKIVTDAGTFLKKETMSSLEYSLPNADFVRVHRSYIIPIKKLITVSPHEKDSYLAKLNCGAQIPVSKQGMAKLKAALHL